MVQKFIPEKILFLILLLIFIAGGLLRATFVDFSDFDYGILSDHFINSVTAKNIVHGLGWSSSGYETYLLNPENLTIGPTVMLPVVGALAIFGNTLPVPLLTLFGLNLVLLFLLLKTLAKTYTTAHQYYLAGTLLLALFIFFKSYYWQRMTGEIPAILLLVLVALYTARYLQQHDKRSLIIAGLFATLAMGTKELTLLPLSALAFVMFWDAFHSHKQATFIATIKNPLIFVALLFLQPALFNLYQYIALQALTADQHAAYNSYANAIHDHYSGMHVLREYLQNPLSFLDIFKRVSTATLWNGGTLLHFSFAGMRGLNYWLSLYLVFSVFYAYKKGHRFIYSFVGLLILMAAPLLLWYFTISERAMPRHLYIGLCLTAASVLLQLPNISSRWLRGVLFTAGVCLLFYTGDRSSRLALVSWPLAPSPFAASAADTQAYIATQPQRSLAWLGMLDNNEFEYLSIQPNNFISASDEIVRALVFDEAAYLAKYPELPEILAKEKFSSPFAFYISPQNRQYRFTPVKLIKPVTFNWLHFKGEIARRYRSGFHLQEGQLCKEILFQNEYYVVERCHSEDIQRFIERSGGLPFRPRLWTPHIRLPSERLEVL